MRLCLWHHVLRHFHSWFVIVHELGWVEQVLGLVQEAARLCSDVDGGLRAHVKGGKCRIAQTTGLLGVEIQI